MGVLPTGTVTFLFTDLEGSTRLWEDHPEMMGVALERHATLLRKAVQAHSGHVVKNTGDGMYAVFSTADGALAAAVAGQRSLLAEPWPVTGPLRVRMGLHSGTADEREGDYFGPVLNRAARLMAVAHGGQVICSQATADLVRDALPASVGLVDLGRHRLRDLTRPEVVFGVTHADLAVEFPPLASLDAFPGNLPTQRSSLIGRTRELSRLPELLDAHRLVTLTGVGGVGKTRLALHVAANVVDRFPDGAWLVALAPIREAVLVPTAVAAALEIPEQPSRTLIQTLGDAIGPREMLLVLDNCEHLLDASARLVDALLDACPGLRVLATSREALGVEGEQAWPTPSLGLPEVETIAGPDDLVGVESVELFVERARSVRPDLTLTSPTAAAVGALCARLDGIPLAIELAAARVSTLSPSDILERLDQRFRILTGGARTALERHQTLQAAVDWSYELLSDTERRLFARLSVFAGGFSLGAAHAVAGDEGADEVEVLDLLSGLIAKSMVIAEQGHVSVRYRMLETLRQYGRDRLSEAGDALATRNRHAAHFLGFLESLSDFGGPWQEAAWQRVADDFDNVRTAFDWFVESGDVSAAMRCQRTIGLAWYDMGEGLRRYERVVALAAALPAAERVESLALAGFQALNAGAHGRAEELAQDSLECARVAEVPPNFLALQTIGLVAFWRNEPARAVEAFDGAIAAARAASDGSPATQFPLCLCLCNACFVLGQTGQTDRAVAAGEEAVTIARRLGVPSVAHTALWQLGLAYRSTDLDRAARLLEESLQHEPTRWTNTRLWSLVAVGQLRSATGDEPGALQAFSDALVLGRQSGDRFATPTVLQGMARSFRRLGHLAVAARLLGAARGLAEHFAIPGGPGDVAARERAIARLRQALGEESFEAEWRAGAALSFQESVAFALQVAEAPDKPTSIPPA